jgi:argininosuccinate lyase
VKMWGGRFETEPDLGFVEFSNSIGFDVRLYPYDIECTRAWSAELKEVGVLTAGEEASIQEALMKIKDEFDNGSFEFLVSDEDIHTAVERRLTETVGEHGGKVRTGRSRNDQVATDLRLLVMDTSFAIVNRIKAVQIALMDQAEKNIGVAIPGHTHLQQAQPVLLAHVLLAFVNMLERDVGLVEGAAELTDSMPLGSGALAGTTLPIDRGRLAHNLGFSTVSENSIDAVSDRDFVCASIFALDMVMVHLSRLSEQIVLWCSQEFGIADLDDAWATGSSLMPQKKNPDGAELVRAKTGRVTGNLVAMLTVLKGLPLSYNRDLQEDKEAFFDSLDTVAGCLMVIEQTVATMSFDREKLAALDDEGFLTATDLADHLVSKGVDFPEAHRIVGEVVAFCLEEKKSLLELSASELAGFSSLFGEDVQEWLSVEASLARRSAVGGTAPNEVRRQLDQARRMVSGYGKAL